MAHSRFPVPLPTPIVSLSTVSLPTELINSIIGLISDNRTLRSCALVAREWVSASRFALFSKRRVNIYTSIGSRNAKLLDLINGPSATFPRCLTNAYFNNTIYSADTEIERQTLYDLCQAFIDAQTQFGVLDLTITIDPDQPQSFDLVPLIFMSSQTLRRLSVTWGSEQKAPCGRDLLEAISTCVVLEHLQLQANVAFERKCTDLALPEVRSMPLGSIAFIQGYRPTKPDGLRILLRWLDTAPEGCFTKLFLANGVDKSLLEGINSDTHFAARVEVLRLTGISWNASVQFNQYMNLRTVQVNIEMDSDIRSRLSILCDSLSPHPVALRSLKILLSDRPLNREYCSDVDAVLSSFARRNVRLGISLSGSIDDYTLEDADTFFPLCKGIARPFEVKIERYDLMDAWQLEMSRAPIVE